MPGNCGLSLADELDEAAGAESASAETTRLGLGACALAGAGEAFAAALTGSGLADTFLGAGACSDLFDEVAVDEGFAALPELVLADVGFGATAAAEGATAGTTAAWRGILGAEHFV